MSVKKSTKSKSPSPQRPSLYIQRTLSLLEDGCYKDNHLKIDGDIGDYRMKLFRKKDKSDYSKCINSVFTNTFTESIMPKDPNYSDVREQISNIIKNTNRNSITPPPQLCKDSPEKQEERLQKGDIKSILQQQEYLFYKYLPEYQRKRWFQVKDRSVSPPPIIQEKAESIASNKKSQSITKKNHKTKHIFAYLQHPFYIKAIK